MICYTDGACASNPGPGGFGVVILDNEKNFLYNYKKGSEKTTNNREELKAILYCLIKFGKEKNTIVYSDSAYSVNTFNDWMFRWANNNWIKSDKKTPENLDIIKAYYDLWQQGYRINLQKVKGHAGDKYNEMADKLAVEAKNAMILRRKNNE